VTGLWVDHSFDIGMPVDATSVSFFFSYNFVFNQGPKLKLYVFDFPSTFFSTCDING
jgi:hypothetical protein